MVLTAAHCIEDRKSGSVTIMRQDKTSNDGEQIKVKEFIKHPNYGVPGKFDNDYGLIVLERATTQDIKLIRLNTDENFPAPGSVARVMGWGRTRNEPGSGSDVALRVDVNVISEAECDSFLNGVGRINDVHICTFKQDKSFCQGDSGEIELSVVILVL
jgi:secreted trypsin-like serine protease